MPRQRARPEGVQREEDGDRHQHERQDAGDGDPRHAGQDDELGEALARPLPLPRRGAAGAATSGHPGGGAGRVRVSHGRRGAAHQLQLPRRGDDADAGVPARRAEDAVALAGRLQERPVPLGEAVARPGVLGPLAGGLAEQQDGVRGLEGPLPLRGVGVVGRGAAWRSRRERL